MRLLVIVLVAACGSKGPATGPGTSDPGTTGPGTKTGDEAMVPCTEETVVGSWQTVVGADFESMALDADHAFRSYLHDRPFAFGTWRLDGNALILESDAGEVRIDDASCDDGIRGAEGDVTTEFERLDEYVPEGGACTGDLTACATDMDCTLVNDEQCCAAWHPVSVDDAHCIPVGNEGCKESCPEPPRPEVGCVSGTCEVMP